MRLARIAHPDGVAFVGVEGTDPAVAREIARPPVRQPDLHGTQLAARRRPAARAGPAAQQGGRHRPQLRRPRRGDGQRRPDEPLMFLKPNTSVIGPGDPIFYPRQTGEPALRGRAGRRDRPDLPRRARRAGDRRDPRLHDRQRRDRARPAEAATCSSPGPRASTRSARSARGSRPTSTRSDFVDGRGVQTHLNGDLKQDGSTERPDLRRPDADRARLQRDDAAARRRDPHRHPRGCRPDGGRRRGRGLRSPASAP